MYGKVLELESERIFSKGREEGVLLGREEGVLIGREEGKLQQLIELVKDGLLTINDAARRAKMSEEKFKGLLL